MIKEKCTESYCCEMKGFLSFLILFLLSKKSMNGQELALELQKRKGDKPSPGTIYPALKMMRESGLIKESKKENSIKYSLTSLGKSNLKIAKQKFCKAFSGIIN